MEFNKNNNKGLQNPNDALTINEKLRLERIRALKTLEKIDKRNNSSIPLQDNSGYEKNSPGFDRTGYRTLNVTDLQTENTIHLESTAPKSNKISFEPAEITGRSTLYRNGGSGADIVRKRLELSVEEILASSCSDSVKNLRDSLQHYRSRTTNNMSKNTSKQKLTEDLSKTSGTDSIMFSGGSTSFSFSNARRDDESGFVNESFTPADLMASKLAADEIAWEQECATIPKNHINQSDNKKNISDFSINLVNLSNLTNFFENRSEDFFNVAVGSKDSPLRRDPVALIDETVKAERDSNQSLLNIDLKNHNKLNDDKDNSYYLSVSSIANALNEIHIDESSSNIMNRVLLPKKIKSNLVPSSKINQSPVVEQKRAFSLDTKIKTKINNNNNKNKENINPTFVVTNEKLCDKNNLSDTVTFTESLLDTTDFKNTSLNSSYESPIQNGKKLNQFLKTTDLDKKHRNVSPNRNSNSCDTKTCPQRLNCNEKSQISMNSLKKRSKSPATSEELYAIAAAIKSSSNDIKIKNNSSENRKRSHSANRNEQQQQQPKITNPTGSIKDWLSMQKHGNLIKTHSSTRLNNNDTDMSLLSSPNFNHQIQNDSLRLPSPIPQLIKTPEKSKISYSPLSSCTNSPRSIISLSQKQINSPPSPYSLETTTNSDRRYLMAGSGPSSRCSSASPECNNNNGKLSLPNYGLVVNRRQQQQQPSLRSNSQCSSSSEFSHRGDKKLPIKVTCNELSWGSTKLRTNQKKSMQIKNSSTKRLLLKISISGPGFQLINSENNYDGNMITLQAQECRTIVINFCPTVIGTAIGKLSFLPPQIDNSTTISIHNIPLYGYGGHCVVIPKDIQQGPIGLPFIKMGELRDLSRPLVQTFTVFNKGPLNAFAVITFNTISLEIPRLCNCIEIEPKKTLIQSGDSVKFRITFKPRRDDLQKIIRKISGVMTIATLQIITGDDPTRQRIRNIIGQMKDNEKTNIASATLDNCWGKFDNENDICGLNGLKEKADVAFELISTFRTHDIAITLNHNVMDDTAMSSNLMFSDVDETIMFRTIVSNSIYSKSPNQNNNNVDSNNDDDNQQQLPQLWSVRPNVLEIDPFDKRIKTVFTIHSFYTTVQDFEISSNYKHLFVITPNNGQLLPRNSVDITVTFAQISFLPSDNIHIIIYMENEKITIPVKIKNGSFSQHFK